MGDSVNVHEAKTHLSRLLQRVASEEIVIAKAGKPVAKLVPYQEPRGGRRHLGSMRGQIWMADDFDAPLPEDLLRLFEGEDKDRAGPEPHFPLDVVSAGACSTM